MVTNLPSYTCTGCGKLLKHIHSIGSHAQWSKDCTPEMRFWGKVDKSAGPEACWPWKAWRNPRFGYGMSSYKGASIYASKVAWIYTHGEPPKGLHVLHKCDYPACCNPAHLFLGTHLENMKDMDAKGRRRNQYMPKRAA